ncbi:hypothetical protein D9758_013821 [Tetrapyrgos nigripes]|uniref:DNA 3'-5' helicase n=1 Tax=Tetrapyrgos nigripes TaxID=182062 RepID=A0A8H5CUI4_9AGAR|nr:hypothetical protein D9758_013821 [Tetrapyrgos nigripes]
MHSAAGTTHSPICIYLGRIRDDGARSEKGTMPHPTPIAVGTDASYGCPIIINPTTQLYRLLPSSLIVKASDESYGLLYPLSSLVNYCLQCIPAKYIPFIHNTMENPTYWQSAEGQAIIDSIVKKRIPAWTNGLKMEQRDVIGKILDGEKVLWLAATGIGKSAAFQVPIIVCEEIRDNPSLYPGLKVQKLPVGLVVMPTKGLVGNIVDEAQKLGISAFAYTHPNLTQARKDRVDIVKVISSCLKYRLICVDPEHLQLEEWTRIAASPIFRSNLIFSCTEEAHLIPEWGNPDFQLDFAFIGTFFRSRLPSEISSFALSATLEPGEPTMTVCERLGFRAPHFHLLRDSNERPNTQFIVDTLTHGLSGEVFPQLLPYVSSGRKTIIHCQTLEVVYHVYLYLLSFLNDSDHNALRRMRVYHSMCSDEYNAQTLHMLNNDPLCQIVIATVAFANGINVRALLDSISLGVSSSFNLTWQEKGRVGRSAELLARGILLVSAASVNKAQKYIEAINKGLMPPSEMNHATALVLTETICYIARINIIYQNPPLELSSLDCITAKRKLPCSLCAHRAGITVEFPPSQTPSAFPSSDAKLSSAKNSDQSLKLTKKEREDAADILIKFGDTIYDTESLNDAYWFRPKASYFPLSLQTEILNRFFYISHLDSLISILKTHDWSFSNDYAERLYDIILSKLIQIQAQRKSKQAQTNRKRKRTSNAKKLAEGPGDSEESGASEESDKDDLITVETQPIHVEEHISESRNNDNTAPVLQDSVQPNIRPQPRLRAPPAKQQSAKEVMDSFGPHCTKRKAVVNSENVDGDSDDNQLRRSSRLRG